MKLSRATKRVVCSLMADSLQTEFNLVGQRGGKKGIETTKVFELIVGKILL